MNEFNEYVRDVFSAAGDIVIKSMMGGYLVYFNGKLIGDICGNEVFLKRTPTSALHTLHAEVVVEMLVTQFDAERIEVGLLGRPKLRIIYLIRKGF